MANPSSTATVSEGFSGGGGCTNYGQTFTMTSSNYVLTGIDLYAGNGSGTSPSVPVILGLYDLGTQAAPNPSSYSPGANLLGGGSGLSITYTPQSAGILELDFTGADQVTLQAGHMYVFEIQGTVGTDPMLWFRNISDTYSGGAAYRNRSWINGTSARDFALAVYGTATNTPPPATDLNWTDTQQRIDGFGFSSAWCGQLTSAKNNALYNTLGMSILRVRIDPSQNWSQETANAAAAHAYGASVLGSEWSPPASMKDNTNIVGGSLLPNQYAAYANWLNLAANSIGLDYVSFQNEPDITVTYESCDWTPTEILNFVKTNAPAIGKPVVMPESYHFDDAYSDPVINDPVAVNNFAILGGHFYGGGNYVHTNAIAHGKAVWMTEHYLTGGRDDFAVCLNWADEINDAMKNQFNAYIAWWAQDGDTNINLADSSGTIYNDGYTLGQFAKFIRPGYYRIGTTNVGVCANVTAYKDMVSSNFTIVAVNNSSTAITQQFNLNGFTASSVTPWITDGGARLLAPQAPVAITGSSFTYAIPASSIVTLVGTAGGGGSVPSAPTGLSAAGGNLVVNLNWTQSTSSGITGNNVYRSTSGSGGPYNLLANLGAATSYSDAAVAAGNTYFYSVTAINTNGESALSAYSGATTVPPAPTGLAGTAGNNQVALSWTASTGATGYNVKRATVNGGPYTTIAGSVTAASYTDTTAVNGTTYYYVVSAINGSGESANSSAISATPSAPPAPNAPTNLTANSPRRRQITLNWTQSTSPNITNNKVYRSTTSGGPYTLVTTLSPTTGYTDNRLSSGTTYYYVVTAVDNSGLESMYSNQAGATAR